MSNWDIAKYLIHSNSSPSLASIGGPSKKQAGCSNIPPRVAKLRKAAGITPKPK